MHRARALLVLLGCVLGAAACGIKGAPRAPLPPPAPTSESLSPDGQRGPLPSSLAPPDSGTP